jgi:hypothetical protein
MKPVVMKRHDSTYWGRKANFFSSKGALKLGSKNPLYSSHTNFKIFQKQITPENTLKNSLLEKQKKEEEKNETETVITFDGS